MRQEVLLTPLDVASMEHGRFARVMIAEPVWLPDGALATSVLVGRVDGRLRAYANVCRHHPLPLDYDAPTATAQDGLHLVCHQHGAIYRTADGYCVDGPCRGERLFPFAVHERDGRVTVILDG